MQSLNVLIIGDCNSNALKAVIRSKYLEKLYTNFEHPSSVYLQFNTFKELVKKCKSLKIDIVFVEDKKATLQGIADALRKNFINCIAINSFWTKLILSNDFAENKAVKYGIKIPDALSYPSEFPVVVKADGVLKFAGSMEEVITFQNEISKCSPEIAKTIKLERFISGKEYNVTSFFDGKHSYILPENEICTRLLTDYNQKLEQMFIKESPDFIGYISSKVIVKENEIYNLGFNLNFPEVTFDLLFLLTAAIYQKLDEL